MENMVAYCGIVCTDCPAYVATQKNDDSERKRVAGLWSSTTWPVRPEDVNCDGCLATGGRLFKFCGTCEVRQCGLEKGVTNCAHCEGYPCKKLDGLWGAFGAENKAKETLEKLRKDLPL